MVAADYITIEGDFLAETPLAVCLDKGGLRVAGDEVWIPKSQINGWVDDEYERGDPIGVEVTEWFASKEGLI